MPYRSPLAPHDCHTDLPLPSLADTNLSTPPRQAQGIARQSPYLPMLHHLVLDIASGRILSPSVWFTSNQLMHGADLGRFHCHSADQLPAQRVGSPAWRLLLNC